MKETISQNYSENWFSIINLIQKSKPNLKKLEISHISRAWRALPPPFGYEPHSLSYNMKAIADLAES